MAKKKCAVCGTESGNLAMHMKSHDKPESPRLGNSTPEVNPNYATKADLDEIKGLLSQLAKKEPATMVKEVEKEAELPDKAPVPPKYRLLVDEILGPDFGINIVYTDSGSGFLFKIIVPLSRSNASSSHLDFYKTDIRTKAIGYDKGIEGVKEYLEKVAKNLKIIKQNK